MIALDTNILARFYIEPDDAEAEKQRPISARLLRESKSLFVSVSVILELEWVLRGGYGFKPNDVEKVLKHLLCLPNVIVENADLVFDALMNYHNGLDFADAVHMSSAARCGAFATFDRKLIKHSHRLGVNPPCMTLS